ncbi:MAG: sodium:alanine symporter family protein, partial [Firmicutes bacterium]|nr:sodium:alanine symporter family protein [Bacillota bacterium]
MLALFLFVGILYTIKLRGFAIFGFREWWKATAGSLFIKNERASEGISSFQAACTALAATIGTGNIAGVATAILAGGPGAIFWMWVSAFLGMATAYGETELGMKYRRRDRHGNWMSGTMVYLEQGLGCRWLAIVYAVLCLLASFGMGCMVQANAISETFEFSLSLPPILIGGILTVMVGKILAGGAKTIAATAEKMVPLSAAIYISASAIVLMIFREQIPEAFSKIITDAFSFQSASGGIMGVFVSKCVRYGVSRGVFSNEAGLGSMAALNGGAE